MEKDEEEKAEEEGRMWRRRTRKCGGCIVGG